MELETMLRMILMPVDFRQNEPMRMHTTFQAGGNADYFVTPANIGELHRVIQVCKETGTRWMVMGRGSNLLFGDKGYHGVVIELRQHLQDIMVVPHEQRIHAEAGAMLPSVASAAQRSGLGGLEFAAGIPGTIGGALVMNAGAYGGEMKQRVIDAEVLTREGEIRTIPLEELELDYRSSCIRRKGYLVLSCNLQLYHRRQEEIQEEVQEYQNRRREKQPLEYGSAGSTFKRPEGYFAGKLIEEAGLKGYRIGDAQVSEKHAGFVINRGKATAKDILNLCQMIEERVYAQFGVSLEMEVQLEGEF